MTSKVWTIALATLALAACGGDRGGSDADTAAADTAPSPAQPAEAPSNVQQQTAMAAQQQVQLDPVGGSGVRGTASLIPVNATGDSVQVTILVSGAPGGSLPAHVHTGTCEQIGPVVAPLENVQVAQGGGGQSSSRVTVPITTLVDGTHLVSVHDPSGKPVACKEIPPTLPGS